jgi:hypothetical protein
MSESNCERCQEFQELSELELLGFGSVSICRDCNRNWVETLYNSQELQNFRINEAEHELFAHTVAHLGKSPITNSVTNIALESQRYAEKALKYEKALGTLAKNWLTGEKRREWEK